MSKAQGTTWGCKVGGRQGTAQGLITFGNSHGTGSQKSAHPMSRGHPHVKRYAQTSEEMQLNAIMNNVKPIILLMMPPKSLQNHNAGFNPDYSIGWDSMSTLIRYLFHLIMGE